MATDMSRLRRDLVAQGFEIEKTGKNRLKVRKGRTVVVMSGNSRCHGRGWQNALARLRKAGYEG